MNLDRTGPVFVLHLDDSENRFNPAWLAELGALLDEVDAATGPRALVTVGTGKFWSNGLDLDWLLANPEGEVAALADVHELLARMLESPYPTVAAIQGHVYAAGAMLAVAHDYRVMRGDRGFLCLPEVDIRIPFSPGMSALIATKVSAATARDSMVFGTRYGGTEALNAGLVDAVETEDALLESAVSRAEALAGKDGPTVGAIKRTLYATALAALRGPHNDIRLPTR